MTYHAKVYSPNGQVYLCEHKQHHVMTRIQEEVSARMPHPDETRLLKLRPGVPVLDVWHTSIDQDGEPYELTRFVMRGDMTGLRYDVPVE